MDKLGIINRALVGTGNNVLFILNDGSDEALAADHAFDRSLEYLMGEHQWPFKTTQQTLTRTGASDLQPFTDLYQLPTDCWHLRSVRLIAGGHTVHYHLNQEGIHTCYGAANPLQAIFVTAPVLDSSWHPSAIEVLTMFTEAHLYRGLNEDITSGDSREAAAEQRLSRARSRVDQQNPARNAYRKSGRILRRTRRV